MIRLISRIAKKLHINYILYTILSPFYHERITCDKLSVDEARLLINRFSPSPTGSSLKVMQQPSTKEFTLQVIVPVYKTEKYVERCIDSALASCRRHSMIITVINDGSPDNAGEILKKYANNKRVDIITQENRGFSGARNRGLEQMRGRYITFLDSDDELAHDALDKLLDQVQSNDLDIIEGSFEIISDLGRKIRNEMHDDIALCSSDKFFGYACGKIFNSHLFEKVQFPKGYWFEDSIMMFLIFPMCRRASTSSTILYRYRMNPKSISHTAARSAKILDTFYITERLLEDREMLGIRNDDSFQPQILYQIKGNCSRIASYGNKQINHAIFTLQAELYNRLFAAYDNIPTTLTHLDKALRKNDYKAYYLASHLL